MNVKKYYFLPFLDNLKAVGITFLFLLLFGSWIVNPVFSTIATILMLVVLSGFVYSRMWKLTRKNALYKLGLTVKDAVKFVLPLVIFEVVLIAFYCLCEEGIIPLQDIIVKSYYKFPENAPREFIKVSVFDYIGPVIKVWFAYLVGVASKGYILFIAPVLTLISAIVGFRFGTDNKQVQEYYINATEKVKKKFNE